MVLLIFVFFAAPLLSKSWLRLSIANQSFSGALRIFSSPWHFLSLLIRCLSRPLIALANQVPALHIRCEACPSLCVAWPFGSMLRLCRAKLFLATALLLNAFPWHIIAERSYSIAYHRLAYPLPFLAILCHSFSVNCISPASLCASVPQRCPSNPIGAAHCLSKSGAQAPSPVSFSPGRSLSIRPTS